MIVCPVCEHAQAQGDECEVCGKKLVARAAAAVAVQAIPELEQTALVRPGIPVPSERMLELEMTRLAVGPDLPTAVVPELERTRVEVGAVTVDAVPDVDSGRVLDDGVRTAAPSGNVACRYCGNVQATGLVCERCGMRLPRAAAAPSTATVASHSGEDPWTRCRKCGAPAKSGEKCGDCGQDVPWPT